MIETHLSNVRFADMRLVEPLLKGLEDAGFELCTPIQSQTLPIALAGDDVAGQGQTGTGKTAAFLLAIFQRLLSNPANPRKKPEDPRAIILAPTRELVSQIEADAKLLGGHTELRLGVAYGGVDYQKQRNRLSDGVDILIGTPGRLIDFFKQRVFGLRGIEVLVLDEADRMFDLGFIKDIRYILRRLPPPTRRLNMLFSATLSHRVTELAYEHMNNPELIRVEPEKVTADKVTQSIYFPSNQEKLPLLVGLLRAMDP
ncbi:MAG: DEAD/DEAH box helicase, partial [Pseudomonadota bacterium]